jgi:hypothetical protein
MVAAEALEPVSIFLKKKNICFFLALGQSVLLNNSTMTLYFSDAKKNVYQLGVTESSSI